MGSALRKKVGAGVFIFMITVCFMPSTAGAFAPGEGRPGKGGGPYGQQRSPFGIWRNQQVIEKLQLTKDQVRQLRDLDFSHRENEMPVRSQIEATRLRMDKAMSEDTVDRKTVLSLAKEIADLKGKIYVRHIKSRLAFKDILTPDQRNRLKQLFKRQGTGKPHGGRRCLPGGDHVAGKHKVF